MEKKLWFKAKTYGWGWTPVTWQGWVVVFVYVIMLVRYVFVLDARAHSASDFLLNFAFYSTIPTLLLIWVCFEKGEKPRWSWGRASRSTQRDVESDKKIDGS